MSLQEFLTEASHNRDTGVMCTSSSTQDECVLAFGGVTRSISSVVLIVNGLCFAIMTVLFTTIGTPKSPRVDRGDVLTQMFRIRG